ncbi:MAG: HNH endonuclease [Alphaproteobacteria bacterium]
MADNWSTEELEASVVAYLEMRQCDFDGTSYSKKGYYRQLSVRFGRTEKAYEYRMQNISYVFSVLGREWVRGLRPARNVGANVAEKIEKIINRLEDQSSSSTLQFHASVSNIRRKKKRAAPAGNLKPRVAKSTSTQFVRDPEVVAWVLDAANGICECCGKPAPFIRDDSTPFLEVHHLRRLADGGSDTITNSIAACPNCHRELHYGLEKVRVRQRLYGSVKRLIEE